MLASLAVDNTKRMMFLRLLLLYSSYIVATTTTEAALIMPDYSTTNNNFRIVNAWSKAGIGTSIVLAFSSPKKKSPPTIAFDLGATPAYLDSVRASCVLLTHGHIDHIGAIFSHARAHQLSFGSSSIPTYYVPLEIVSLVKTAIEAMAAIDALGGNRDGSSLEMNVVGVIPGVEVVLPFSKLSGVELFIRPFQTTHAGCPSVGYILGTRRKRSGLKAEYQGLPGEELRELARSGVNLKEETITEELDMAYTGDTTIDGLLSRTIPDEEISTPSADREQIRKHHSKWHDCHTVFSECTFLDKDSHDMAQERGHMHIDDIVRILEDYCDDEASPVKRVVLVHISGRYGASQALAHAADAVPPRFHDRIDVAVMSLSGSEKYADMATTSSIGEWTVSLAEYVRAKQGEKPK